MKKVLMVAALALLVAGGYTLSTAVKAQNTDAEKVSPEHTKAAKKLLQVMQVENQGRRMMQQMIGQFKKAMPQVDPAFWDKFLEKVDYKEFVDMMVPIYAKHLSQEDLNGLVAFFESPLGQRFIKAQPGMAQDSTQIGMKWGQKLVQQVMAELQNQAKPEPDVQ